MTDRWTEAEGRRSRPFRFFDNREKYLLFVTTCGEKWAVAKRVGGEIERLSPRPPALRVFDAGTGDGTVLASVLRQLHERHPTVPVLVVGKEISLEDVRLTLAKLPDRFAEHPSMVIAMSNMHYREAPGLWPSTPAGAAALNWREIALEGDTAHEFGEQLDGLRPLLEQWWQVRASPRTGNPLYETPSVLILYRADRRFLLDGVIPRRGAQERRYDLVIAAQPYRSRQPAEAKVKYVLEPLARALAPGGRMIAIQSTGQDPGMEIIRRVWPGEDPFATPGPMLAGALEERLQALGMSGQFHTDTTTDALFRFALHSGYAGLRGHVATSTLLAAWNAAVYVAQIDDRRLAEAMTSAQYLQATRDVLARHAGLWFIDEAFVVTRAAGMD